MLNYLTFSTVFELQCFIVSIICLSKSNERAWKILPVYLLITCIAEVIGIYLKREHQANQWPYNILLICHVLFTSYLFLSLFRKHNKSKLIIISGLVILTLLYLYDISQHGFLRFNLLTYNTMSVIFTIYSLYYFYLLLKDDQYINLKYSANFWWVAGVLFFYFGNTAVNLSRGNSTDNPAKAKTSIIAASNASYGDKMADTVKSKAPVAALKNDSNFSKTNPDTGKSKEAGKTGIVKTRRSLPYHIIYAILNLLLYSCWSYSFICKKWLQTSPI